MSKIISLVFLSIIFVSCNLDQVTTKYDTFDQADKDDFFVKGWIPIELINENVTKIFVRSNLDLNTYIFSFNIDKMPITFMEEPNLQTEKIKIHRLDIPSWWNNGIIGKPKTFHRINSGEIINLVLDEKNGIVYGWKKNDR